MNTTPAMCQYAETVFSIAVIVTSNMLTITAPRQHHDASR